MSKIIVQRKENSVVVFMWLDNKINGFAHLFFVFFRPVYSLALLRIITTVVLNRWISHKTTLTYSQTAFISVMGYLSHIIILLVFCLFVRTLCSSTYPPCSQVGYSSILFLPPSEIFFYVFTQPGGYSSTPSHRPREMFFNISPQPSGIFFLPHSQSVEVFFYVDVASLDQTMCSTSMELACVNFIYFH